MAEALYRKYRPQVFSDVVGQDHIERTLKNAIEQDKVSHAYLFCGPRGTGKTTTARLVAKALLCENGPTPNPDGTCESCEEIANGEHPDVYELDAASRTGVENVREEIIGRVQFAPTRGRYKVYIIDEVHMLSTAAFNALLKTLEEPPAHVVFILCTTDPQKVPETILSRCQRFDFRRIASEGMTARLEHVCQAEGVTYETEALEIITRRSDGGLRNALTALEQAIAFGNGSVTVAVVEQLGGTQAACDLSELMNALANRDVAAAFTWLDAFAQTGGDIARLANDVAQRVRDMYFLALAGAKAPLSVGEEMRAHIISQAKRFAPDRLAYMLTVLGDTMAQLKSATNGRLVFEIALTKICHPASDLTLEALAERVEALEQRSVAAVAAAPVVSVAEVIAPVTAPEPVVASESEPAPVVAEVAVSEPEPAPVAVAEPEPEPEADPEPVHEPEPVAEPAPRTLPATVCAQKLEGFQNPAAVQRVWQIALSEIKRGKPAYSSLLMNARVSFDAANSAFAISFPAASAFMLSVFKKPEALDYLRQTVCQAAGTSVNVIIDGAAAVPAKVEPKPAAEPVFAEPYFDEEPVSAPESKPEHKLEVASVAAAPAVEPDAVTSATPGWSPDGSGSATQVEPAASADDYDEVPLDAYADFVGGYDAYDDDDPYADEPVRPAPQPAAASEPASEPVKAVEPAPWEDDPFAIPDEEEPLIDLGGFADLMACFGDGVKVEEL